MTSDAMTSAQKKEQTDLASADLRRAYTALADAAHRIGLVGNSTASLCIKALLPTVDDLRRQIEATEGRS